MNGASRLRFRFASDGDDSTDAVEQQVDNAFYGLLYLIESAGNVGDSDSISLESDAGRGRRGHPAVWATLAGPCIVIDNATSLLPHG